MMFASNLAAGSNQMLLASVCPAHAPLPASPPNAATFLNLRTPSSSFPISPLLMPPRVLSLSTARSFASRAFFDLKGSKGRHPVYLFLSSRGAKDTTISKANKKIKEPLEIEKLACILEGFKMVLVVRNDLKMGKGKIAAQCSHASLGLYKKLLHRAPEALSRWERFGQPKVVVKIDSEEDMLVLQERAKSLNIPTHITVDAGRTQIAPNSRTVMAVLGPIKMVDDVSM
ncbi:hypothetical protein GQ457_06G014350 [Hibiscus cannabinus]